MALSAGYIIIARERRSFSIVTRAINAVSLATKEKERPRENLEPRSGPS